MRTSRRAFIGTGAATAAHVWIPRPVKGYTAEEMMTPAFADEPRRRGEPVTPMKAGVMKSELDTPALCVDLDKLERNIAKMQRTVNANKIGVRPHAKTHKCAAIARLQMAAGALGICVAKLSEAEALMPEGLDRVLMTTSNLPAAFFNVGQTKVKRPMR